MRYFFLPFTFVASRYSECEIGDQVSFIGRNKEKGQNIRGFSSGSRGGGVGGLNPPSEFFCFFGLSVYENSHGPGP